MIKLIVNTVIIFLFFAVSIVIITSVAGMNSNNLIEVYIGDRRIDIFCGDQETTKFDYIWYRNTGKTCR